MVTNHNMPPPPPAHHPPQHPQLQPQLHPQMQARDIPRVIHNPTPGPIDMTDLTDDFDSLHVNTGRYHPARANRGVKDSVVIKEVDPRSVMHYDGYTFFKSETMPGHTSTWKTAEKTKMNLSQADLYKMVEKRSKRDNAAEHYSNLSRMKRIHIDDLIKELEHNDPRYEWSLVYIKEEEKAVKGKGARRGDYETLHMDVVLMRKPVAKTPQPNQVNFDLPSKAGRETFSGPFDHPAVNQDPRQMNKAFGENNAQWAGHGGQVPTQMGMNLPPQGHPHFHPQQQPQQHHQQQQHPPPPPHHQNQMGGRPQVNQEPWVGGIPQGPQQVHHQQQHPDMLHAAAARAAAAAAAAGGPRGGAPPFETLHQNHPGAPAAHPQAQRQFAQPGRENFVHFSQKGPTHGAQQPRAPKPPPMEAEILDYPSSSGGDDESAIFDPDEYSSSITESDDDIPDRRGSLYRRHSSKSRRNETSAYRKHYRKQPRNGTDPKYNHAQKGRYPTGYVDVVPATSKSGPRRLGGKRYHQDVVARQSRDRPNPKIVQGPVMSRDEMEMVGFEEMYRGHQARSDLRSRLLDEREARVERREQLIEDRARLIDEHIGDANYLGRTMSLREPPSYRRRYLSEI